MSAPTLDHNSDPVADLYDDAPNPFGTGQLDSVDETSVASPGRLRRLVRGNPYDPAWVRPSLLALLIGTAVLYIWGLSASGWSNSFYSAAAQAGSTSWKAFFFGSSDAGNSITVDKPALAIWPQALAVRMFGLNSWSLLVPEALMGVGTVGVVYATVRRWFTPGAGLLSGLVVATTPVAALMFRFNNPDAMLVLLMAIAAYTALRAVEDGRMRWFVATGVAIGFGFLAKQLQVVLVVPGFGLAYLAFGQAKFGRRLIDLGVAFGSMIVAAGWWIAIVELWPASSRPYIGGSQTNSILELTLGYNGLGRITGDETGSVGGGAAGGPGGGGGSMWGATGITRMFNNEIGGQIAWLLPAALVCLVIGLWLTRRAKRTDLQRASLVVWGAWLVVTTLTFSFMSGIFHAYYTVALAPAIGALVGIGTSMLWARRTNIWAAVAMAVLCTGSAMWARTLLDRAPDWSPWLGDLLLVAAVVASLAFLGVALAGQSGSSPRMVARLGVAAAAIGLFAVLAAPASWAIQTASAPHTGSIPTAGPTVAGAGMGPGGGQFPGRGFPGGGQLPTGQFPGGGQFAGGPGGGMPGGGGGMGGLLEGADVSDELAAALSENASDYTWIAATTGSQNASSYQLATEHAVMPIGGFNGSDPSPTLEEFQQYVADGEIHFYISSGLSGMGSMGGSQTASEISSWVEDTFTATTVDGVTLYDLASPA